MIVGGYDLHLYCDHQIVNAGKDVPWCSSHGQYCGPTARDARREARRRGWSFRVIGDDEMAICPKHSKRKKKAAGG